MGRSQFLRSVLGLAVLACAAWSQMAPGGSVKGPSRALALPLSGQGSQSGSVVTQQTANPGSGVGTVNSSVQVSGSLGGSIAGPDAPNGAVSLTLSDAIKRGLATNLGPISAANAQSQASANRLQARSDLLPNIGINASETVTQVNLAAYGLSFQPPPGFSFSIPTVVGPYSYSQLQGTLSQPILDVVNLRNYKALKQSERAAALSVQDTRELVIFAVAGTYLQTLAASSRLIFRSLVELQTQQQRLSSIESDFRKQKIALVRLIGLPLDREVQLREMFSSEHVGRVVSNQLSQEHVRRAG